MSSVWEIAYDRRRYWGREHMIEGRTDIEWEGGDCKVRMKGKKLG